MGLFTYRFIAGSCVDFLEIVRYVRLIILINIVIHLDTYYSLIEEQRTTTFRASVFLNLFVSFYVSLILVDIHKFLLPLNSPAIFPFREFIYTRTWCSWIHNNWPKMTSNNFSVNHCKSGFSLPNIRQQSIDWLSSNYATK